jgi:hypothetical protein
MTTMEKAVEYSRDSSHVTEHFSPVLDQALGSQQGAGALVPAHDDL